MTHHGTAMEAQAAANIDLRNYAGVPSFERTPEEAGFHHTNPWQPRKPEEGPGLGSQLYHAFAGLGHQAYSHLTAPFQEKIENAKEFLMNEMKKNNQRTSDVTKQRENFEKYDAACAILNGLNGNDLKFIFYVGQPTTTPAQLANYVMQMVVAQRAQGGKKKSRKYRKSSKSKKSKSRKNRKTRSRK